MNAKQIHEAMTGREGVEVVIEVRGREYEIDKIVSTEVIGGNGKSGAIQLVAKIPGKGGTKKEEKPAKAEM
jgi:hypothetical protein